MIPNGAIISSARIAGTYGTLAAPNSTAGYDLTIEGATLTACVPQANNCWRLGTAYRPFSLNLPASTFAGLLDGSADLFITQTNQFSVRFGTPTLSIDFEAPAVPEPATWAMLVIGFGLAGSALRQRRLRPA